MGFFSESALVKKEPTSGVPQCGRCGLYKTCRSPKMPPSGEGTKKILIVGEAPGKNEDEQGRQFCGETGELLRETLGYVGCNMRTDCRLTNALICRPPGNEISHREMIDWCRPNLIATIKEYAPEIIILLGTPAVQSLLEHVWKDDVGGVMKWAGCQIPSHDLNAWICPAFHPSYVSRSEDNPAVKLIWRQHLAAAWELRKRGRPFQTVPDYTKHVRRLYEPAEIVASILTFIDEGKLTAFDFECNMLKPDYPERWIVSCSLSNGFDGRTIAFPFWSAEVRKAFCTFIDSNVPKVASNLKYEERWCRREFGRGCTNWKWDTMLAAHVIDSRPGITSIKFQAFALLGAPSWDGAVKQYLEQAADSRGIVNRIKEIDLDALLLYNGLDSLMEVEVAKRQMAELGILGGW